MLDRADYSLSDLLLFSDRVYYRMFELHNAALWPLHILALIVGLGLIAAALRPTRFRLRAAYIALAVAWLFVAWTFFLERYADINWAAVYVAPAFGFQALFLAILAQRQKTFEPVETGSIGHLLVLAVLIFSLIGYPFTAGILMRPSWLSAEVLAITPDPTATATLAILALSRGVWIALASVIPLLWIIVTSLTLYTLGSLEFVISPLATLTCVLAVVCAKTRSRPKLNG